MLLAVFEQPFELFVPPSRHFRVCLELATS